MQDPDLSNSNNRNLNESVWSAKKGRQQTEKDIEKILNKLQLLKKELNVTNKKIVDTRDKTQRIIDSKKTHMVSIQQKKLNMKQDNENLRSLQEQNRAKKQDHKENIQLILCAMQQIKKDEHDEIKEIKKKNKELIKSQKKTVILENVEKTQKIKELQRQQKDKINQYWTNKLGKISRLNEEQKIDHLQAQAKNEALLSQLEEEETSLFERYKVSSEIQEQLGRRLIRAINLPHHEFKKIHQHDDDIIFEHEDEQPQQQQMRQTKNKKQYQSHTSFNRNSFKSKQRESSPNQLNRDRQKLTTRYNQEQDIYEDETDIKKFLPTPEETPRHDSD